MPKKTLFANPDSAEREYVRDLVRLARETAAITNRVVVANLGSVVEQYRGESRTDAWGDTLDALIAEALRTVAAFSGISIRKLPGRFEVVSRFNKTQFKMVVKANTGIDLPDVPEGAPRSILGADVFGNEPKLQAMAEGWVSENTRLITNIPEKALGDIDGIVRRGVMQGKSVKTLSEEIKARYPMTEARAKLIAQNETLRANSLLTQERLKSVGVTEYIWRTVRDSRVRPEHVDREGKTYSWDKPPPGGNHPGLEIRCRCRSEALWPE